MLNFVRAKHVDYVPSKLANPDLYKTLPQGSWVLPVGIENNEAKYDVVAAIDPVADAEKVRSARISFSTVDRSDVKEVQKITSLRGVLTLETDQFIAADEAGMDIGVKLTLKVDSDGFIKLGTLANATDEVVGIVDVAPSAHSESLLVFHSTLY